MPVTSTSTLMKNHVAGRPLRPQRQLGVAYADDKAPILISLDEDHRLAVTLPSGSSGTGWVQVDLSAQLAGRSGLGPAPTVQCFAVSQEADGKIWLAVAAADGPKASSKVFLSQRLPNTAQESDWTSFAAGLVPRAVPAGSVFTMLTLGSADDGAGAPHIVGVAMMGDMMHHYQINPDPADTSWTCLPLVLPQNATRCLAATTGNVPGLGRGVYALCELGTLVNLTFTTLPRMVGGVPVTRSREFKLPAVFSAATVAAIAALPDASGQTELYLSGAGLHRYSLAAQAQSNQPGEQVADAALFSGTAQLAVSGQARAGGIDIWALNSADLLVHVEGAATETACTWEAPAYLSTEVTALATYHAPTAGGTVSAAALGKSDGTLALIARESDTNLWQPQSVSLPARDTALALDTYTTRIIVTDTDGVAVRNKTVDVRADADVGVLANGQYFALKRTVAKPVPTDASGVITIVRETADLAAPVYTVVLDGASTPADAGAAVKDKLRAITSGRQIASAQRSDGSPLFPKGADSAACDAAAGGVQKLMAVHDGLADPARAARARALSARRESVVPLSSFGVRHTEDGVESLHGEAALAAQRGLGATERLSPGDLLATLWSGVETVSKWFVNAVQDGWQFLVDLGGRVVSFLFEAASQAIAAIDWVLEHTLGISLEDIVAWLGYLFNWGDILRNHRVLTHVMELGFDHVIAQVGTMQQSVRDAADTVRGKLIGNRLIVDQSNNIFTKRAHKEPAAQGDAAQSAQANWGGQQMTANGGSAAAAPVTIGDLTKILTGFTDDEIAIISNAADQFKTLIIDQFDTLTWDRILQEFLGIVGAAIINTAESVALTILDAVAVVVAVFKQMATARWDIPVITYVYEQIICGGDGSQLTLLDLAALLVTIPATIICKAVTPDHRNLFSAAAATAVLSATTWDTMLTALTAGLPSPRSAGAAELASAGEDPVAEMIIASEFLIGVGAARALGTVCYWQANYGPPGPKDIFTEGRIAFDWVAFIFSMVNLGLVTRTTKNTTSARYVIDSLITSSQLLIVLDTVLAAWKRKGKEPPLKLALPVIETVFGLAIVIGACVSIGLQTHEPPPEGTSQDVWDTLIALKFIQNCMTGLTRSLAFVPALPDTPQTKPLKEAGKAVRGASLTVRAIDAVILSGVSAYNTVSDVF